eukprot:g2941.t1
MRRGGAGDKRLLATAAERIAAEPDKELDLFDIFFHLHRVADQETKCMAILSAVAVFKDLVPGYRIREPTEQEKAQARSKSVLTLERYELKLLQTYRRLLPDLEASSLNRMQHSEQEQAEERERHETQKRQQEPQKKDAHAMPPPSLQGSATRPGARPASQNPTVAASQTAQPASQRRETERPEAASLQTIQAVLVQPKQEDREAKVDISTVHSSAASLPRAPEVKVGFDFNYRQRLIGTAIRHANSSEAEVRGPLADQRLEASKEAVLAIGRIAQAMAGKNAKGNRDILRHELLQVLLRLPVGRADAAELSGPTGDLSTADDDVKRGLEEACSGFHA